MVLCEPQHRFGKIFAVPVQPCRAEDKIFSCERLHEALSFKLCFPVCADRARLIEFRIRSRPVSGEHIIRGHMYQLCVDFRSSDGKVARTDRVDAVRCIPLCLTGIHIRVRRTVDDDLRTLGADKCQHGIHIGDVKRGDALALHHVCIDKCHLFLRILCADCTPQLTVTAGNQYLFHPVFLSYSSILQVRSQWHSQALQALPVRLPPRIPAQSHLPI